MRKWLIALAPAVLIVVLLGYMLGSRAIPQAVVDNLDNAAMPPDISGLPDDNVASALPAASVPAAPADPAQGNVATPGNATMPADTDMSHGDSADRSRDEPDDRANRADRNDSDPDAEAQARREIAAAVRRATIAALDSGAPTHWHKDGLEGDVAVSAPQDDGADGSCRTVTATMGTADDRRQSGDHVWCQGADGGDWAPQ